MKLLFSSSIALLLSAYTVTAQDGCISKLSEIYKAESELEVTADVLNVERTYVLCKDTTFYPGRVSVSEQQGKIDADDDTPLVCRSKCRFECQDNTNCIIDGSSGGDEVGTYGIVFMPPKWTFGKTTPEVEGVDTAITISGITVSNWKDASNQIPIAISSSDSGANTDITFKDCNFENNIADPLFLIDEISGDGGNFNINFEKCNFKNNSPSEDAQTQGGLSLLRFRGIDDVNNPIDTLHTTSNMNATFTECDFENNSYILNDNNDDDSLALIDFYSKGTLTLKDNCFTTSPTQKHGVITVQDGATVTNDNNHYSGTVNDAMRTCPFISTIDAIYENRIGDCTADTYRAMAATCRPAGFVVCFPGDTTVETISGEHVPLSQLQLGTQIRVPGEKKYETVYSFGHKSHEDTTEFLQFSLSKKKVLEISSDHMVYLPTSMSYVPASMIQIGDSLQYNDELLSVRKIQKITKSKGVYAPFTTSGTLLVNGGIVVSSYIAFQNSSTLRIMGSIDTGITYQSIAYAFEFIHRTYCFLGGDCTIETYTSDGLSTWIAFPYYIVTTYIFKNENTTTTNNNAMLMMMKVLLLVSLAAKSYYYVSSQKKKKIVA